MGFGAKVPRGARPIRIVPGAPLSKDFSMPALGAENKHQSEGVVLTPAGIVPKGAPPMACATLCACAPRIGDVRFWNVPRWSGPCPFWNISLAP